MGVLEGLNVEELNQLVALGSVLQYDAGDVVIREQSGGREWYIVLKGLVRIDFDAASLGVLAPGSTDPHPILTLGPGGGFGEIALFDAEPRSAAVVALEDATQLLVITPQAFDALLASGHTVAITVLRNLIHDLAAKIRNSRLLLLQQLTAHHHVRTLCEELEVDCTRVDPLIPLQKTLVMRDRHAFVLGSLLPAGHVLSREILDVLVFAAPGDLHALLTSDSPAVEAIVHGLFSLLRHGRLSAHAAHERLSYRYAPELGRRAGTLLVSQGQQVGPLRIDWEVKGLRVDRAEGVARANLCLTISSDATVAPGAHIEALIAGSTMPIQRDVVARLKRAGADGAGYRVLTVHHRTHEVAQTLHALRELGFQLDAFVGIPYGEASWATSLMLDHASGRRYHCLQTIPHPAGPTRYQFNSLQSSFLPDDREREIAELYADPAVTGSYRAAMDALLTYLLEHAIRACRERGERLLLYEDGAYLTPLIYTIYHSPGHRLHQLVWAAVDSGLLAGSVEVTTSGERAQAATIREHGGRGILPVISGARDDVKLIFEAGGVAEAVLHAASTALGNLGLPTFGFRRVAVLGGNGAIGVRVVEQLAQIQRSVEQIYCVDPVAAPFARPVPVGDAPAIAGRLRYQPLPRYSLAGPHLPLRLWAGERASVEQTAARILAALDEGGGNEVLLRVDAPLSAPLWEHVARRGGYHLVGQTALDDGAGCSTLLRRNGREQRVTVLGPETVLRASSLQPLLRLGIDTVIGVTGTLAFTDGDLDAFLERPAPAGGSDDLVLISGSSKDYEFQRALVRLNAHAGGASEARGLAGFEVRKSIHPDVGSIYHLSRRGVRKRLILLADGFVVNFFARYEKGVKTEYMDPIMTMQLLSLIRLAGGPGVLPSGLHQAKDVLPPEHMRAFWHALDARCVSPDPAGRCGSNLRRPAPLTV